MGHPSWIPRLPGMKRPEGAAGGHPTNVFERQYAGGAAPWDLREAQPEIVALEDAGVLGQRVLDVGCGTGQTAVFLAGRGHEVVGIDGVADAIQTAEGLARERSVDVTFVVGDVLAHLASLADEPFDAVTDVGFFHALSDDQRERFAEALAHVLVPGGVYAMLCFSERVPGAWGPRRVSEADIRATFSGPQWRVREVRPAELHSAVPSMPVVDANLALVERAR